ncbi:TetR/AcrR family transcriptional regulator [Cryptosporangium japonicum]|uniref:TetR/AcrR family transcriptional regulator n=1 Tax=Cryptosporangium japonicum TaxID=80872 RepID=A0ABP3EYR5_9ACTN
MAGRKPRSERRHDLIEAARRAMVRHGAESVHLNQIAEEAGLTSGAVLYHYPDISELLIDAHHAGMERFYELRVKAIEALDDPVERLLVTIRSGLPTGSDDADVRLLCELGGAAGRSRVYAALLTTLFDRQVSMYQGILEAGVARGVFTAAPGGTTVVARNLVALEDAYGYRIVARHPTIGYAEAVDLIVDYARLATGNPLADPPKRTTRRRRA